MSVSSRGPASRSKIACKRCRERHLKCDQKQPCDRCQANGAACLFGDQTTFILKQWTPEEAGLPPLAARFEHPVRDVSYSFINENDIIEDQYAVSNGSASPTGSPGLFRQHHSRSPPTPLMSPVSDAPPHHALSHRAPAPAAPLTSPHDAFFLDRYSHIVGPWFDLLDSEQHFTYLVPHISLSHPLLLQSALACAAKQHYLTSASQRADAALTYYDDALRALTTSLHAASHTSSTAVFASCLLLAHCEMIDASDRDWHLHLAGTLSLVLSHGWHGRSAGLAQSCFWIYCRMDVLSSLATATPTRLDTARWNPPAPPWTVDAWANTVVLLLAETHNLLCALRARRAHPTTLTSLRARLAAHAAARPFAFHPLATLPPPPGSSFAVTRYVSDAVCAAAQMFDLTHLLLLLCSPDLRAAAPTAAGYVHAVIANSVHNRRSRCWVNAVQLLTSAGAALGGGAARRELVACLRDIQTDTGWNTAGNVDALVRWWGEGWEREEGEGGEWQDGGEAMVRLLERVFEGGPAVGG
ncbi:hypothetical protein EDC01DRAFT_369568 [Geopyxis carbonaria]|nr:hypothetical protein EDC01DRAFT_369568 [Geopyxis carbonaria]